LTEKPIIGHSSKTKTTTRPKNNKARQGRAENNKERQRRAENNKERQGRAEKQPTKNSQ
jgi:hypothetical protein